MNITTCYSCASGHYTLYANENGYSLAKCDDCGLLFVENRPDDNKISGAHKQGVHGGSKGFNVTGRFNPAKIPQYLHVLNDLFTEGHAEKKTWLDVGCGHGEFLMAVQKFSSGQISVRGTEPNIHKQQSAQKRGLDVGYFDIESHKEKYDVISLLNVYSHLPDPPAFLNSLANLLKPDGELVLETGDTAELPAKDHPRPFFLPDHLSFASERILSEILQKMGFDIVNINKYPFLKANFGGIGREAVKAVLPQHSSRMKYYFKGKKYSQIDMYVRARKKS